MLNTGGNDDPSQGLSLLATTYDSKNGNVKTTIVKNSTAGTSLPEAREMKPLMTNHVADPEVGDQEYDPFLQRNLPHPTSDWDTLVHLLKGSLGTGILAMPLAFRNAGLAFGMVATFIIGFICTYCVHVLVKCAHELCRRTRTPSLGFAEVAEAAFKSGPPHLRRYAKFASSTINTFLVVDLLGCCCVYIVFVAKNLKQVADYNFDLDWDIRVYMLVLLPLLIPLNLVRNLKLMAPFSLVANILIAAGMSITFYYVFQDLPAPAERPQFSTVAQLPLFFGTAIFALEGIGVVMPLENNMKTPTHFIGCPGVLNIGMAFVVTLYSCVGFFGYLKYGEDTEGSITLNLPTDEPLAQSVKGMIAIAIFLTYALQFYVPFEIIWRNLEGKFSKNKLGVECCLRTVLVVVTVAIAAAIPNLGPFISLVGAVCLSTLGLMFPALIEVVTFWEQSAGGPSTTGPRWRLFKNVAILAFGVLGFVTGTWTSIQEIIQEFGNEH